MIARFIKVTMACALLLSCTNRNVNILTTTFNALADSSDKISILPITEYYNGEDTGVTLTMSEIQNLRNHLPQCISSDSCGSVSGQIVFSRDHNQIGRIGFTLNSSCPVIYIWADGKLNTFRMSYQTGMMLNELLYQANKIHH